ncbi:MAG: VWA domain-containing protein [Bacteroidota bacterium]
MHYTDFKTFSESFTGFTRMARDYGLGVGLQESRESVIVATEGLWMEKSLFKYALASLFCTSEEDREIFEVIFKRFWMQRGSKVTDSTTYFNKKTVSRNSKSSAVMLGQGKGDSDVKKEEAKNMSGANGQELIRNTDFTHLSLIDSELLDEIAEKLLKEMSLRLKRKKKKATKGQIQMAQTIRKNIQKGGNIIDLVKKDRKKEKYRLVILLDVSGSMDKYSFYLLKFIWGLRSHFSHIEAFAFSTKLMRITEYLDPKHLGISMAMVSQYVTHWSSGTKIGECLKDFNENYAKRYLNGKTLTIVLSDGLDTGEPELLSRQLQKIKYRTKKLVWLNPLKGMAGYQPIQRGMAAAMPTIDAFHSAHNLDSLLQLENIIANA